MNSIAITIREIPYQSTWSIRQEVMWPDQKIDYVKLAKDNEGLHYGLFYHDKLVSIVSVFIEEREAQFRKFATLVQNQGCGYGSILLSQLFLDLEQRGISRIWCNARVDKTSFYERFGMAKTPKRFKKGGIEYIIMEKFLNEN